VKKLSIIALGGVAGSLTRYLFTESITSYPIAILISNLIGVAVAGLFAFRLTPSELSKHFWIPGFAGGLTTFSSVALIYAERIDLLVVGYFYGTVLLSLAILYAIAPKAAK
jgi:fluoride ion exporter CrcB/FEX